MTPHGNGHGPDPAVVEAVEAVRDRFGAAGLRDMIGLAQQELVAAQEALVRLREAVDAEDGGTDGDT
jgi:hypothetical protein